MLGRACSRTDYGTRTVYTLPMRGNGRCASAVFAATSHEQPSCAERECPNREDPSGPFDQWGGRPERRRMVNCEARIARLRAFQTRPGRVVAHGEHGNELVRSCSARLSHQQCDGRHLRGGLFTAGLADQDTSHRVGRCPACRTFRVDGDFAAEQARLRQVDPGRVCGDCELRFGVRVDRHREPGKDNGREDAQDRSGPQGGVLGARCHVLLVGACARSPDRPRGEMLTRWRSGTRRASGRRQRWSRSGP